DRRVPADGPDRPGPGDEVHAVPRHAVVRDDPRARQVRRGLGADERHELGVRAEWPHGRGARALLPPGVPDVLRPARRPLGAREDARRRAALPPSGRDVRTRRRARLAASPPGRTGAGVSAPRVAALIPAYQAASSVAAVVQGTCAVVSDVVVVDDGSTDPTGVVARAAGATVLR